MITPPEPPDEQARLASLARRDLLDSPPEERFDRLTRLGALALDAPICLVSLVDECRQWFKSKVGIEADETPRDISFCGHAILEPGSLVVRDALLDHRFSDNPLVTGEPRIRFYAGRPLSDAEGHRLGTFCVIDTSPRAWSAREQALLDQVADLAQLELTTVGLEVMTRRERDGSLLHRSVVSALEEGILVVNRDGIIEDINKSTTEVVGLPDQQIKGRHLVDLGTIPEFQWEGDDGLPLPPEQRPIIRSLFHGESVSGQVVGLRRQSGDVTWLSVNSRPIGLADDGQPERAVLTIVDITHRREMERMKNEFVAVVSHELRTPLTSIRGALGLLAGGQMGPMEAPAAEMLDIAVANADRLIRLINDILDIERLESGPTALECSTVPLGPLFDEVVALMAALADQVGVALSVSPTDATVWADSDRVCQTVTNLVSNAIKFSPPGGTVCVEARSEGTDVLVRVQDQGRGIPSDKLEKIFDRFGQADAQDTREKEGTGLGLAICREVVTQLGGRIWVDSELGQGSTFSFTLPASGPGPERCPSIR